MSLLKTTLAVFRSFLSWALAAARAFEFLAVKTAAQSEVIVDCQNLESELYFAVALCTPLLCWTARSIACWSAKSVGATVLKSFRRVF